ncbi:hypothetical protein L1887_28187 [Cichorium endivia]|nr:hypothetical protein L1887_28187 [Cichorium endivia]
MKLASKMTSVDSKKWTAEECKNRCIKFQQVYMSLVSQKFAGRERLDQIQKLFDTHHDLFSWENLEMVKVQHTQTFFDCSLERHAQSSGSVLSSTMENELRTCLKELIIGDFLTINDVALADPILSKSKMAAAIVLESRDNKEMGAKTVKTALVEAEAADYNKRRRI